MLLSKGDRLNGQFGGEVVIDAELGSGGQGEVYSAKDATGSSVAVKWFYESNQNADFRTGITDLVIRKAPSHHFLWPEDIVERTSSTGFGYVMALRSPEFVSIPKLLRRVVAIKFPALVRAANQTVSAFRALQSEGLFYCDISAGNLFLRPKTGDILICDNDNVGSSERSASVRGTPRYMAPEIARGEADPSAITDSYSMAVLLFILLMNDHPLDGASVNRIRAFDAAAMKKVYGTNPVFVFDPDDASNRPEPGIQQNAALYWELYPRPIKEVFTKVFTAGVFEPGHRPSFTEWQQALAALEDSLLPCAACTKQNFYDTATGPRPCWSCGKLVTAPLGLLIDSRRMVVLNTDTQLYGHHMAKLLRDPGNRGDALAAVAKHPTKDVWGLKNLGQTQWFATLPDGTTQTVEPGKTLLTRIRTRIDFGEVTGEIVG